MRSKRRKHSYPFGKRLMVFHKRLYSIAVRHREYFDDDGHRMVEFSPLQHAPLEKEPAFQLSGEDPKYYKNEVGYNPVKEWEEPLPTPPSTSSDEPQSTPLNIDPEKIRMCQEVHDMQVKVLESFGIDACRTFEESKVEHILEAVQVKDTCCPMCKKALKGGGTAIKTHIRAKHMRSTPFACDQCSKTFGNNQLLRSHLKTHTQATQFPCTHQGCKKSYPSKGRLNSHLKTHDSKNQVKCQYCPKTFNQKKNLAPHELTCKMKPGGKAALVKDKQCPFVLKHTSTRKT